MVELFATIAGEMILLLTVLGSHLSPHIWTDFPFPIRQTAPLLITSRPLRILLQANEALIDSLASIILQSGKNRTLKTR